MQERRAADRAHAQGASRDRSAVAPCRMLGMMVTRHGRSSAVAILLVLTLPAMTGCTKRGRSRDSCQSRPLSAAEASALAFEPVGGFAVPGRTRAATLVSSVMKRSDDGGLPAPGAEGPLADLLRDPALRGIAAASTEDPAVQILLADPTVTAGRWCQIASRFRKADPNAVLILESPSGTAAALEPSQST